MTTSHSPERDTDIVVNSKNKGGKATCGNSRGISLLSVAVQGPAVVVLQRLVSNITGLVLPELQCGFKKNRSMMDDLHNPATSAKVPRATSPGNGLSRPLRCV